MKKVICVDAKTYIGLTTNKGYPVISETENEYEIIDDNGDREGYDKRHFRLVPEAEYQPKVGDEVEFKYKDDPKWFNGIYVGLSGIGDGYCIKYIGDHYYQTKHIRPVQSMRDKVIQEIQMALPPIKGDRTAEVLADRIIELVKNEKE